MFAVLPWWWSAGEGSGQEVGEGEGEGEGGTLYLGAKTLLRA